MLLSPLGPRGKLRPEWEFGTELREHSLAAGPGPVYGSSPIPKPSVLASSLTPVCSQLWWPTTRTPGQTARTEADGFQQEGQMGCWSGEGAGWWLDQVRTPGNMCSDVW